MYHVKKMITDITEIAHNLGYEITLQPFRNIKDEITGYQWTAKLENTVFFIVVTLEPQTSIYFHMNGHIIQYITDASTEKIIDATSLVQNLLLANHAGVYNLSRI